MRIFFFLLIVLHSSSAWAFYLMHPGLKGWAKKELIWSVNTSGCPNESEVLGYFDQALEVWNSAPTSDFKMTRGGTTTATPSQIGFNLPVDALFACDTSQTIGPNYPYQISGIGGLHIINGNIGKSWVLYNINSSSDIASGMMHTLVHEVGHAIGFGHSEDPRAVMAYSTQQYLLAQDDIDAMTYLYPKDDFGPGTALGCGTILRKDRSDDDDSSGSGAAMAESALLLLTCWMICAIASRRDAFTLRPFSFLRNQVPLLRLLLAGTRAHARRGRA